MNYNFSIIIVKKKNLLFQNELSFGKWNFINSPPSGCIQFFGKFKSEKIVESFENEDIQAPPA